ncbi:SLBB domain-containing protein [Pseudoalteromonas byunsanensis]|uniref:Polysaccharide biosynthesis protein n=1 Tax=Pseudoalteromonas byunsanensis TaxID=327939 RepID=A0A1S1N2I6_9GAMM|nr:SLBB domain-containing protein [Pseudoalteromonas byunsanensis]OHU95301.1 hypothetical protein BIW53_11320 [Pseudoalteromonas byunsanensis]
MQVKRLLLLLVVFLAATVHAATPSQQQLKQFSKLPKSQQKLLAEQYGIDLGALNASKTELKTAGKVEPVVTEQQNSKQNDFLSDEEKRFKPETVALKPFGSELFSSNSFTLDEMSDVAVPNDYVLGVGDQLKVSLFGQENIEELVEVDKEGRVKISDLSPMHVMGMSYKAFSELLQKQVSKELIGTSAFVSLASLKSIRVFVVGEVQSPGSYTLPSLSTITHSLYASGGLTDIGSLRNVQLKRKGKLVQTLDLYDLLLSGNSVGDVHLKSGDTVFVPSVQSRVTLKGSVRREAIFELKEGETLSDLIRMSGGMKASAYKESILISRYTDGAKTVLEVDSRSMAQTQLRDGDEISISDVATSFENEISLVGAVVRPGKYAWRPNIKIRDILDSNMSNLLPQADRNYGLIVRGKAFEDTSVIQFNIMTQLSENTKAEQLVSLEPSDKIYIFSRFQYKDDEEKALRALDLTQEELEQQERSKLWNLYENQLFQAFVNTKALTELNRREGTKTSSSDRDQEVDSKESTNRWLFSVRVESEQEDEGRIPSPFSRISLLEPVLQRLNNQASPARPVRMFTVQGRVKYPGNYPLAKDYTVADAIEAAGGLLESAYLEVAEMTSYEKGSSMSVVHKSVNLKNELTKPTFKLASKDAINVLAVPKWMDNNQISIAGEVTFPGVYTIKRGESLQEVLARAGGLTEFASIEGAVFTREEIKKQEKLQIQRLSENLQREIASKSLQPATDSISYTEIKQLLNDLDDVEAMGRLVIDLDRIIDGQQELVLQHGDALYVPSKRDSISVIGEVNYPASHLFENNLSVSEYIQRSGGVKKLADDESIYVIKANGAVLMPKKSWFSVDNTDNLNPGDTIVVPLDSNYMDNLTLWSTSTQIIYQLGVAAAAINNI